MMGSVHTLPVRPRWPTLTIGGERYVLSDQFPFLEDMVDDQPEGAGAMLHDMGGPTDKFRFLWVINTDHNVVAMWQIHEGNEKVYGPVRSFSRNIIKLDAMGQMNRVDTAEFMAIEREMHRRADDTLQSLQSWVKENESEHQKHTNRLAQAYYDKVVAPKVEDAIQAVEAGAVPLGFKFFGGTEDDRQTQMQVHAIHLVLTRYLTEPLVENYMRQHGLDPEAGDIQASQWAVQDIRENVYRDFKAMKRVAHSFLRRCLALGE